MSYQQPPATGPENLPVQRLYLVEQAPNPNQYPSPEPGVCGATGIPQRIPRGAEFICQAEWSWSPMHGRLQNYHVSLDSHRRRWVFWVSYFDDNFVPWRWQPYETVLTLPRQGIPRSEAAQLMLGHYWKAEFTREEVEQFHWLGATDLLSVGEIMAVANSVWGEGAEDDD